MCDVEVEFSLSDGGEEVDSGSSNVRRRDVGSGVDEALAAEGEGELLFLLAAEGGVGVLHWHLVPLHDVQLFVFVTGSKHGQRAVEHPEQWLQLQQRSDDARPGRRVDDGEVFVCVGAGFSGVRGGNSTGSLVSGALLDRVFTDVWGLAFFLPVPFFLLCVTTVCQGGLAERTRFRGIGKTAVP